MKYLPTTSLASMAVFAGSFPIAVVTALSLGCGVLGASDDDPNDDVTARPAGRSAPWLLDDTTVARELVNPASPLLRIENTLFHRRYQGRLPESDAGDAWVYELTPVYPIVFDSGRVLEVRATIPVSFSDYTWEVWYGDPIWELDRGYGEWLLRQSPQVTPSTGRFKTAHGHLDDVRLDVTYGGMDERGFIGMYGIAASFPSSTDITASRDQFLLGPEVVLGRQHARGIYGARLTHMMAVSGDGRYDVNETRAALFFAWQLRDGWQLVSNPSVLYDWEGDSGNRLLLPVGGGISRTTRIGRIPLKLDAEVYYYAKTTERFGTEWQFSLRLTPVLWNPWED